MTYKNKTYIAFDADKDMHWYRLLRAWKENESFVFDMHDAHEIKSDPNKQGEQNIKRDLKERFKSTKQFILLVGESTKNKFQYVRWEIEQAIINDIPIIVINLNNNKKVDQNLCPAIIRDQLSIHISFKYKIIKYAVDNWPENHRKHRLQDENDAYHYSSEIYRELKVFND